MEVLQLFLHVPATTVRTLVYDTEDRVRYITALDDSEQQLEQVQNQELKKYESDMSRLPGRASSKKPFGVTMISQSQQSQPHNSGSNSKLGTSPSLPSQESIHQQYQQRSSYSCFGMCRCGGAKSIWIFNRQQHTMLAKISLMFFVSAAFFLGMYFWTYNLVHTVYVVGNDIQRAEVGYRVVQMGLRLRDAYAGAVLTQPLVTSMSGLLGWSKYLQQALLYGSSYLGIEGYSGRYEPHDSLLFGDNCFSTPWIISSPNCASYNQQINKQGLVAVVEEYSRVAWRATTSFENITQANPVNLMNNHDIQFIHRMHTTYLSEGLSLSLIYLQNEAYDLIRAFDNETMSLLIGFLFLLVFMYIVFYRPMLVHLQDDSNCTRGMLFMVPYHVLDTVPQVKSFFQERAHVLFKIR